MLAMRHLRGYPLQNCARTPSSAERIPRSSMSTTDTLSRRLALLALLPRYPGETTAAELHRRPLGRGYEVDLRTVQRDLHHLSNGQQLTCDESQLPYRWSLTADAPLNLANLDTPTALALNLAERHLETLLPHSVLEQLRPHFAHARRHLRSEERRVGTECRSR